MKFIINNKRIFYAGLVYFICILLFIAFRILWLRGIFSEVDPIINDLIFSVIIQIIVLTMLPFFLYKWLTRQTVRQVADNFFFKKIDFKTVIYSILTGILVYVIIIFVSSFWSSILVLFGYNPSSGTTQTTSLPTWLAFIIAIISTSFLPGFGEEIAHRGLILSNTKSNGLVRAIMFSALLFALAHLNIAQAGYAFVVGLILGSVTLITRSIFPAMIIHATSNFCSVYMSYASQNNWYLGDALDRFATFLTSNIASGIIVSFLILSIVLALLMMLFVQFYARAKTRRFEAFCQKLYQDTQNTPMADQINFGDKLFMFNLFNQAIAQDLKQKLDRGAISKELLEQQTYRTPLYTMINSEFDEYNKPHSLDYLFYYITIFLGSVVTIITMIWGIL